MKKGQGGLEFVIISAFLMLLFVAAVSFIDVKSRETKAIQIRQALEDSAQKVIDEIKLASSLNDGYSRQFSIPRYIDGQDYAIKIIADRELIVSLDSFEHVVFLPPNTRGIVGRGINKIEKKDGIVYLTIVEGIIIDRLKFAPGQSPAKISFNDDGSIITAGREYTGVVPLIPSAQYDEFIVKTDNGEAVAIFNTDTGDIFLKSMVYEYQQEISRDDAVLSYVNENGEVVIKVDTGGNLYLRTEIKTQFISP